MIHQPDKDRTTTHPKGDAFYRGFAISVLPKWMQDSIVTQGIFNAEIAKAEKNLGKEKTAELVTRFSNEAHALTAVVNSKYIISKLRDALNDI